MPNPTDDLIAVVTERQGDSILLAIGDQEAFLTLEQVDELIGQLRHLGLGLAFDKYIVQEAK